MIATVEILMHCPLTIHQGWHKRRLQKMVKTVFTCLAYADPTGMFDVRIYTHVDQRPVFGTGTYTLDLSVELPKEKIEDFIRYAKQVNFFHSVIVTSSHASDTIPPCTSQTDPQPATSAT
jgi:hypothetical protein